MTGPLVTGMGVVAPNGVGVEAYWSAVLAGVPAIGPVRRFDASGYPSRLAAEVDPDAAAHLPSRLLPQTDHMTRLALVAAEAALADAAVAPGTYDPFDQGVVTASSAGGFDFGHRELEKLWRSGNEFVSAYQSFAWFYAVNTGQISIRHGLKGPSGVIVTDAAGGLDAIAQARRQLRRGSRLIVGGGVDGSLCSWGWVAKQAGGRLSESDDPARAYLPFDARAAGHVPGEGGAILVIEDADAARGRGAPRVYGEIAGYGASFDPAPESGLASTLHRAVTAALTDAGMEPGDIDVVFADGAAVPELDWQEATQIATVFGPRTVPVTVPKTMFGRLDAGSAALDVATALLAIRDGVIPATVHVEPSADYPIDLVVGEPVRRRIRAALVIARGHGGFNSALIVRSAA
ncbi:ketosynthase chain-length factor [Dactylosporangium sp. NPDC050688]|uniref:ketosynthase chain-length factor n=1 Tax=Dactylosporangium sp. NPDC050688 TaxID=3157217 RepID=UPI0033D936CB